jgi:hypothetical protein
MLLFARNVVVSLFLIHRVEEKGFFLYRNTHFYFGLPVILCTVHICCIFNNSSVRFFSLGFIENKWFYGTIALYEVLIGTIWQNCELIMNI